MSRRGAKRDSSKSGDEEELEAPKKARKAGGRKAAAPKAEKPAEAAPMNQTSTSYKDVVFGCDKKNKQGKAHNLVISSWNVDGLRAWLKKDGLKYLEHEKPDVLCLQETKCSDDKLPDEVKSLEGYETYWCASKKEGYAGVGLISKAKPIAVSYGIGAEEQDEEGRCITAEYKGFYLVNVYVPNAGRKLITMPKRLEWNDAFKEYVAGLDKKKPVVVCGDMNVAHNEIDLANPKTNTKNAGFTKEEREGMTDFLGEGYVDVFRHFYPDQTAAYTFWSYMGRARAKNVGWRLDYFIASKRLTDNVCETVIRSEVFGSDHCPIALFINI